MSNKLWILRALILVVVWLLFWAIGTYTLDPDFGWHLKVGELIAQHGLPKTDPFSYTMPTFPWIDHGWLSDYLIGKLYPLINRAGLSAIYASLALSSIWIVVDRRFWKWIDIPLILASSIFLPYLGIRPQIADWFFTAILLRLIWKQDTWIKWRWITPILFCLWANLHGGFAIGLVILIVKQTIRMIERKDCDLAEILILTLSALSTLLNPYGIKIWQEIWLTVSDTGLKWSIIEWQPFFAKVKFSYWLLSALAGVFTARYWRQIPKWKLGIAGIMFAAGLSSLRYMPLFAITSIPLFTESVERFYHETRRNKFTVNNSRIIYRVLLVFATGVFAFEAILMIWSVKESPIDKAYPISAVNLLNKTGYNGNLFSSYNWGGYLIWKLPGKKVFVDGRMPSWRWNPADGTQSAWAFKDYQKIMDKAEFKDLFRKYNIKTVLLKNPYTPTYTDPLTSKLMDLLNLKTNDVKNNDLAKKSNLLYRLSQSGWKETYSDNSTVIYTE